MSDDKKPFTVSDRRHFTPEGESRSEDAPGGDAPSPVATAPADEDHLPDEVDGEAHETVPSDFGGLVVSLATQASLLLGGVPGGPPADLDAARSLISLLEMLQDKTRGNRTPEEDRLLEDVLYQLRMAFVMRGRSAS
jgi:hypothetical protein